MWSLFWTPCKKLQLTFVHIQFTVLREEEKSREVWFGKRFGGFQEMKEGVDPEVVDIPELAVSSYNLAYSYHS